MTDIYNAYIDSLSDLKSTRKDVIAVLTLKLSDKERGHISVGYLGENPSQNKMEAFLNMANELKQYVADNGIINATITGSEMFGPEKNIPVRTITLCKNVRNIIGKYYFVHAEPEFDEQKNIWSEYGHPYEPNYHISLKGCPSLELIENGTVVFVKDFYLKRIGARPFYSVNLLP